MKFPWRYAENSLVLIKAVMATEIPPLDNSFCNYVDDTLGGHFEMNTGAQRERYYVFNGNELKTQAGGCTRASGSG